MNLQQISLYRTWPDLVNHRVDRQISVIYAAMCDDSQLRRAMSVKFITDWFNCAVYGPICCALVDTESLRPSSHHTQSSCRTKTCKGF